MVWDIFFSCILKSSHMRMQSVVKAQVLSRCVSSEKKSWLVYPGGIYKTKVVMYFSALLRRVMTFSKLEKGHKH